MKTTCEERRKKMVSIKRGLIKTTKSTSTSTTTTTTTSKPKATPISRATTMLAPLSLSLPLLSISTHHNHHQQPPPTKSATSATNTRRTNDCKISITKHRTARTMLAILTGLTILSQLTSTKGSHQLLVEASSSNAVQSLLLDTTEQRSLGWTKYPDGGPQTRTPGWVEESFTNFERGINWRSFVVCDVAFNSVNNWLWTPFIERGEANRLYIEIKFTMRDCNLFPSMVLSCKETFALLYKEMDSPIQSTSSSLTASSSQQQQQQQQQMLGSASNASFAQSDSYTLIDAIAADEGRFTSNTDVVINTEVRSIPVSKRGVYFAFRDQGACLSLISIKVYHLYCPKLYTNFAYFNATPTGRDLTSLVSVEGSCVPNSLQIEQPKMFCTSDGNWNTMSSGQCKCLAGFEPASNQTKCQACQPGKFKASLGDLACQLCPDKSSAPFAGASECKCYDGYFRSSKDLRSAPCTQPPSAPWNLSATYIDSTSVILQWQQPRQTGNRDDLTYKLICDSCDQTMVSSPIFYSNFSETKCVLSGLSPSTIYRFVVYAMNGVSHLTTLQSPQFSEISVQTLKPILQTTQNTLSAQGGFQMTPIYNLRAIPGARGSDMVLAWDAQALQTTESGGVLESIVSSEQQFPSLYEIKYQPRHLTDSIARRSPYSNSLIASPSQQTLSLQQQQQQQQQQQLGPLSITTTNKAVAITTLQPKTEYAFQIRTKWSHTNQWTEFSEPIYMSTTNQMPPPTTTTTLQQATNMFGVDSNGINIPSYDPVDKLPFFQATLPPNQQTQTTSSTTNTNNGWLSTFLLVLMCILITLAFLSITLIHYRKTNCLQSLAGGFGTLAGGSTYGGVYGTNVASGLMSGVGGPLGFGGPLSHAHAHHHHHHHATLSASSAGGLITGSNGTSRSSSGGGAGSVVQNFIAATLGQISGHSNNHHSNNNRASKAAFASALSSAHNNHSAHNQTMGGDGKLFASPTNQHQQRNHYHQTLSGMNHTMLLNGGHGHFEQVVSGVGVTQNVAQLNGITGNNQFTANNQPLVDPFKYRTLGQPGAQFVQQDPQMHIYDDLDNTCSLVPRQSNEIDPQQVSIESVIGRGEFGDVCLASLRSNLTGVESRVAVKTLKAQASDKAKLDFLVEASIMSQFEHPNIIRLEGVVTKSEPPMIICEFMENGSLDTYLRDNKNRFTCLQLISMLRGVANGMQYLAKLNYVHKDLAARNILVNGQNVCKIADFGLSVHQSLSSGFENSNKNNNNNNNVADYTNDSTSTNSSNTLSSQATGSTPTTASTIAGSNNLNQLQSVAEQIAQQRFCLQQQQQQLNNQIPISTQPQLPPIHHHHSIQNPKIPVRWTALEAIAFRRFSSASDVWSYGIVCWEVMTQGERPYFNWSNQDVIKAVEQGYRLPQPEGCPEQLYKMMLDCWLKDRAARPTFSQILKTLDRLLSPYDDPFCQLPMQQQATHISSCPPSQQPQLVPMHTRISSQEPAYYDTYNPISQLINNKSVTNQNLDQKQQQQQSVDEWLNSIKMSRYRENFQHHQINSLQYVARLNQADLNLIGIQNSQHLKKLTNAIASLRTTSSIGASGEGYLV